MTCLPRQAKQSSSLPRGHPAGRPRPAEGKSCGRSSSCWSTSPRLPRWAGAPWRTCGPCLHAHL